MENELAIYRGESLTTDLNLTKEVVPGLHVCKDEKTSDIGLLTNWQSTWEQMELNMPFSPCIEAEIRRGRNRVRVKRLLQAIQGVVFIPRTYIEEGGKIPRGLSKYTFPKKHYGPMGKVENLKVPLFCSWEEVELMCRYLNEIEEVKPKVAQSINVEPETAIQFEAGQRVGFKTGPMEEFLGVIVSRKKTLNRGELYVVQIDGSLEIHCSGSQLIPADK